MVPEEDSKIVAVLFVCDIVSSSLYSVNDVSDVLLTLLLMIESEKEVEGTGILSFPSL